MQDEQEPLMNGMIELEPIDDTSMQRRDLFRGAGTLAAFLVAANRSAAQSPAAGGKVPEAKPGPLLPQVPSASTGSRGSSPARTPSTATLISTTCSPRTWASTTPPNGYLLSSTSWSMPGSTHGRQAGASDSKSTG